MHKKFVDEIYPKLSNDIVDIIESMYKEDEKVFDELNEICIKKNEKLFFVFNDKDVIKNYVTSGQTVDEILEKISNYSLYSIQNELNGGYITVNGGHRIGIAGTCVLNNEKIENVKEVSGINFRIAREKIGCGKKLFDEIYANGFKNTLVISPPGFGKTTIIRDLCRLLSNEKYKVSIIDERSEIACMYNGVPQMNVGVRTDVINKCPKHIGIRMAIRSLSPQIILVDEIGNEKDVEEIYNATVSGVMVLASAHGKSIDDIQKGNICRLFDKNIFKYFVFLKQDRSYMIWSDDNCFV